MAEKELAKKAFEYRKELVPYTDVAIPLYEALDIDRAFIAGAKAMQEKMKCCLNCKYGGMYSEGLYCYAPREVIYNKQMNEKENCCDKWELAE
jgi:hypothetical protein